MDGADTRVPAHRCRVRCGRDCRQGSEEAPPRQDLEPYSPLPGRGGHLSRAARTEPLLTPVSSSVPTTLVPAAHTTGTPAITALEYIARSTTICAGDAPMLSTMM